MRLASTEIIRRAAEHAKQDLDRCVELWPYVAEQQTAGSGPPRAVFGAGGRETVVMVDEGMQVRALAGETERDDRRAQLVLLDALWRLKEHARGVEDAVRRIDRARAVLAGRVPAVDAALRANRQNPRLGRGPDVSRPVACRACEGRARRCEVCGGYPGPVGPPRFVMTGRVGTSGVSLEEADRQRRGAVEAERACEACERGVSVVGRLRVGLCEADYRAWLRDGRPERQGWVVERRRQAAGGGEVVSIRKYRDGLREVA